MNSLILASYVLKTRAGSVDRDAETPAGGRVRFARGAGFIAIFAVFVVAVAVFGGTA